MSKKEDSAPKMKKPEKNHPQKNCLLKRLSLVFLIVFFLTVVLGLLISGSSVALFTSISDPITLSFVAEEAHVPSLQDNLDQLIEDIKELNILSGANHLYRPTDGNPAHAWSIKIEDYLKETAPTESNRYGYKNPVSNSEWVINQADIPPQENYWNPAVFITTTGPHTDPGSDPDPRLWGSMIIFNTGQGENMVIRYFIIDQNGIAGNLQGFNFSVHN